MKRIVFKFPEEDGEHFEEHNDLDFIIKIAAEAGYKVGRTDARLIWEAYSESLFASWLIVHPEKVLEVLLKFGIENGRGDDTD